jgi:hypothetical protein
VPQSELLLAPLLRAWQAENWQEKRQKKSLTKTFSKNVLYVFCNHSILGNIQEELML